MKVAGDICRTVLEETGADDGNGRLHNMRMVVVG
jgi:hypothetical protein